MAVAGVHVRTDINVVARANVYSANEIVRIFYEVVSDVGLNVTDLAETQPVIEKGPGRTGSAVLLSVPVSRRTGRSAESE